MSSRAEMLGRTLLGRYRIVMPIGQGGMGTVYLARTEGAAGFAKPVVIKQILPALVADGGMVQLFIREARILSNLHHPGIVNVLDFGEEDDAYVMVLEYVHGYNLAEWAKYVLTQRKRIPVEYLIHVATQVLDTLHYAHTYRRPDGKALAIIHRDVSPGNVLLDMDGHVKLSDFGIARATDDPGEYRSRVGSFKGKLAYSAPELIAGEEATARSDVYAVGVVLLHLLVGNNPFRGNTMAESVQRVLNLTPPPVSSAREDVPLGLDEVVAKALQKSPGRRYPDAAAFAEALRENRDQTEEQIAAALAEQLRKDFGEEMASMMGLEPLANRDAAWRGSEGAGEMSLHSTVPPPRPGARVSEQATLTETTLNEPITEPAPAVKPHRRGLWMGLAIGSAVLGVGGIVAAVLLSRPSGEAPPQFVIIDRRSVNEGAPAAAQPTGNATAAAAPAAASAAALAPTASATGAAAPPATASAAARGATDSAALSRAVQQQGGRIQGCFNTHVDQLGGSPQIMLRFNIDASGSVTSAQVSPGSVAGTALGACLTGVAQSIKFPPQSKAISFNIPITARVAR